MLPNPVSTASELAVILRENSAACAEARELTPSMIAAAYDSGLFRLVAPTSLGGAGMDLASLAQVTRILGTGCPAIAWTLSFSMLHAMLLSRFGDEATDEFFTGEASDATAAAPLAPVGKLTETDGGYLVNGTWEWATGIQHSTWVLVHSFLPGPGFATRFCALRVGEVVVHDVWNTSGMRATGSNTVEVQNVFVPHHRTIDAQELMLTPAVRDGDGMANTPTMAALAIVAAAPALGAAERAVELFEERLRSRILAYSPGTKQVDQASGQMRLAEATAYCDAARAVWELAISDLATIGAPTFDGRVRARLRAATAVRMSRNVITTVCDGAGASIYAESSPLQRIQRDVEVLKGHVVFDWDRTTELAGRTQLGFEPRLGDLA